MKKMVLGSLILLAAGLLPALGGEVQTLPPAVYSQMKSGKHLAKIWISPAWKGGQGFTVGKVEVADVIDSDYANVVDYLPYRLRSLSTPDSPNTLSVTVTEISFMDRGSAGYFSATMGVEGQIVDKDGKLLVAFRTRETNDNRETVTKNFELVMNNIVWSLSRDLGKDFTHGLEVRQEVTGSKNPSGLVPPPPPPPHAPRDIKSRLLRLDDLLKKGLITPEEYQAHKEQILKGL
jgi:hypothetical protein